MPMSVSECRMRGEFPALIPCQDPSQRTRHQVDGPFIGVPRGLRPHIQPARARS